MPFSPPRRIRGALLAGTVVALALGLILGACGSGDGGSGITLPSLSTTTTAADSTTTAPPTTQAGSSTTSTTSGDSTTTTSGDSTTTTAETTTTTAEPTTTTAESTTTTEASTTTTAETTTTTAEPTTTTIDGEPASSSDSSSWLWVAAVVLILVAVLVAVLAAVRSRKATRARWLWGARDVAGRSGELARTLDNAAAVLVEPAGADRRVWLDAIETLAALAATAGTLAPDAPPVPGDPEGTNSLGTGLESLRNDLTVLRSSAVEAERTRFELVGPTQEQLDFAARSVRQAAAAVIADAHTIGTAADRVAPPPPAPGTPGAASR